MRRWFKKMKIFRRGDQFKFLGKVYKKWSDFCQFSFLPKLQARKKQDYLRILAQSLFFLSAPLRVDKCVHKMVRKRRCHHDWKKRKSRLNWTSPLKNHVSLNLSSELERKMLFFCGHNETTFVSSGVSAPLKKILLLSQNFRCFYKKNKNLKRVFFSTKCSQV